MFELRDGPPLCRLALRGNAAVALAAGIAFGAIPPLTPCRAATAGPRAALWLGPDEWLLLAPRDALATTAGDLARALAGRAHSLVDVSDASTTLLLEGAQADLALRAGCPLDLHADAFPPGMATRTALARIGMVLWRRAPAAWQIEVAPSPAAYARAFLAEAARGLPAT